MSKKKSMRKKKIIICDTDKCDGCRICEYACAAYQDNTLNPRHSRIRVIRAEPIFNVAMSCVLCDEPDCIKGCPTQAIEYDEKERVIKIDNDKCDGCGLCIERCRYGSITLALGGTNAFVCDFCRDLGKPKCVEFCPKGALSYEPATEKNFQGLVKRIKEENEKQEG